MEILYIADDGRKFDDEEECRQYEYHLKWATGDDIIIGLDKEGNPIKYSDHNFPDEVMFIAVKTPEAIKNMEDRNYYEDLPVEGITEPGAYFWDEKTGIWQDASTKVNELQEQIALLKCIIEKAK